MSIGRHHRLALTGAAAIAIAALGACMDQGLTDPTGPVTRPALQVASPMPATGLFVACKQGTVGHFTVTLNGAPSFDRTLNADAVNGTDDDCQTIATEQTRDGGPGIVVTVTEQPTTGTEFVSVTTASTAGSDAPTVTQNPPSVSFRINVFHGITATFFNKPVVTCTPTGNPHHNTCAAKKCDADKSLKDPHVHDENHDCRSESGEIHDPKFIE